MLQWVIVLIRTDNRREIDIRSDNSCIDVEGTKAIRHRVGPVKGHHVVYEVRKGGCVAMA